MQWLLLPMMAIRGCGSYLRDVLKVLAIHRNLARSTFYYQCQAAQCADQQSAMEARIRTFYDEHKGRYGYQRARAGTCFQDLSMPADASSCML